MKKTELSIVALSESESQAGQYVVILEETENKRRIPVIIGLFEAQAIAVAMEKMQPARPLTHDLFKNTLDKLSVRLREVLIYLLENETFYAQLILIQADNSELTIDARTSDALAMAVRYDAPIFAYDFVIEEAGLFAEELKSDKNKGSMQDYSLEELELLLKKLLAKEDFESAARIRDAIDKRKK
jgi:uncharacterized protein